MKENSPYEGLLDRLNGRTCLGRVIAVDAVSRTVRVRTLGMQTYGTDDLDLQNTKIGHIAWHPNGTYGVYIPQIGEYILIAFLNSEAIALCSYPLSNTTGGGGRKNQTDDLGPGDFGFVTIAGSRVIIRSGGTVEIEATKGCRTYLLPTGNTHNTVCDNYELEPAGGYIHWTRNDDGETLLDLKAYGNDLGENAVRLQMGATASGALLDFQLGPTDDELAISKPTVALSMQVDGTTSLTVGEAKITLVLTPDGKVTLSTEGDVAVTTKGKVSIDAKGDATVNTEGDAKVVAKGKATIEGKTIILNKQGSGITTAASHLNVIDLITGTPVQPSTTTFGDI